MWRIAWTAILVGLWTMLCEGKVVYKSITMRPGTPWLYLTKFGVSVGQGTYYIKARFKRPYKPDSGLPVQSVYNLDINLYLDTKWNAAMEEPDCYEKDAHRFTSEHLQIRSDGEWSQPVQGPLRQRTRPYVWFLAAADCNRSLHTLNPGMPQIELYMHFTGEGNTEFSHEELGLLGLYTFALVFYTLVLGYNVYNYYKDIKKTERIDSPILFLLIAVGLEFLSILLQWINLLVYSHDGEGVKICHIMSVISEVGSQFFLSLLLILLSWGWTITYLEFGDIEMFIPLVVMLLVVHLVVAGLTELTSDAYHKYHDFEGIQGVLLVMARLGMFAYFLYGMRDTYQKCRAKAKAFLKPFAIYAGMYMVSFPVLIVVCQICAHYVRHQVMSIGIIVVQSAAMCILLRLFIGKTSYTEVSKHSGPILPSGKGDCDGFLLVYLSFVPRLAEGAGIVA